MDVRFCREIIYGYMINFCILRQQPLNLKIDIFRERPRIVMGDFYQKIKIFICPGRRVPFPILRG